MKSFGSVAGVGLAVVLLVAPIATAAGPQDIANSISEQVMSPFCPGVTLHDCPSDNAIQLRSQIAAWAARGWSAQRIMAKLVAEYGPDIRAVPSDRGAFRLVWLLPAIALVLGTATAGVLAWRWTRQRVDPAPRAELAPHDRQRLEEELALIRNES
jgi:cytochrome c-type biogenesis protein CcmH/NrfF